MTNFTKEGKCSRCGQCCSNFIPLTRKEIQELQELVKTNIEVQIKTTPDGRFIMMCPFLILNNENEVSKCSIYEHRPSICKMFKCSNANMKLSAEESAGYYIVDLMKDIVHYDYQKEAGMTYEEAMEFHINKCRADRDKKLKEMTNGKKNL